jgi:hypothetical protein
MLRAIFQVERGVHTFLVNVHAFYMYRESPAVWHYHPGLLLVEEFLGVDPVLLGLSDSHAFDLELIHRLSLRNA